MVSRAALDRNKKITLAFNICFTRSFRLSRLFYLTREKFVRFLFEQHRPLLLHFSNIAAIFQQCNSNIATTVSAVWVVSINNTARKNRCSRRRKRTSGDAKGARYLNSSGAERRTNKACGDKYSTIPFGKLRQPTYGSALARYFSSCRTLRPSRKRAHLMESKSARTREGNLDFASLVSLRLHEMPRLVSRYRPVLSCLEIRSR